MLVGVARFAQDDIPAAGDDKRAAWDGLRTTRMANIPLRMTIAPFGKFK